MSTMKIVENKITRGYYFDELGLLSVFRYKEDLYLKIQSIPTVMVYVNAINLETGGGHTFAMTDSIIPVDSELHILT